VSGLVNGDPILFLHDRHLGAREDLSDPPGHGQADDSGADYSDVLCGHSWSLRS
jgi:hypothetical protein